MLRMALMLTAKDQGADSIPSYEIVKFPAELRPLLDVPEDEDIVMGIALGYAVEDDINDFPSLKLRDSIPLCSTIEMTAVLTNGLLL